MFLCRLAQGGRRFRAVVTATPGTEARRGARPWLCPARPAHISSSFSSWTLGDPHRGPGRRALSVPQPLCSEQNPLSVTGAPPFVLAFRGQGQRGRGDSTEAPTLTSELPRSPCGHPQLAQRRICLCLILPVTCHSSGLKHRLAPGDSDTLWSQAPTRHQSPLKSSRSPNGPGTVSHCDAPRRLRGVSRVEHTLEGHCGSCH